MEDKERLLEALKNGTLEPHELIGAEVLGVESDDNTMELEYKLPDGRHYLFAVVTNFSLNVRQQKDALEKRR